jgi:hypothetical protein
LFSGSFSADCCSLLKALAAVGTDISLFSGSFSPTAAGAFSKLQQSALNEPENKEVSVPTAGALSKLQQSPLNEPENKEVSAPTAARAFRKLEPLAALGTDTSWFSGSCSDDCPSLLSVPAVVGIDTSLFSV